jgi:hypothetical protein
MKRRLYQFISLLAITMLLIGTGAFKAQSAKADQPTAPSLLNKDNWKTDDGGDECDDDDSVNFSMIFANMTGNGNGNGNGNSNSNENSNSNSNEDPCDDDNGNGNGNGNGNHNDNDGGHPTKVPTQVPPTVYVPTQTSTIAPTNTNVPSTPTDEPTVNPPTATPTAISGTATATKVSESTATPQSSLTPQPSDTPEPTASPVPPIKEEEQDDEEPTVKRAVSTKLIPVTGLACDSSDKILSDNGEDIFWFDSKLGSKINITKSLGGINTHAHFDPTSECPRMAFLHGENAGQEPEIWIYDGDFYAIQNEGKSIQAIVVRWSAKDKLAFISGGYLYTVDIDGTNLMALDMYGINLIDWSKDGEVLAMTNDDHALIFLNSLGEILATKSDSYMSELKWMSEQDQICGGELCVYISTLTEGSFVIDERYADYLAFNPSNGAEFVLSDESRMAIYPTENFVEGTWLNLDWFSINKAPRQPIRLLGQENLCMSFEDSDYSGTSIVDFMLATPGFTSADWSREGREIWMKECHVDNNYDLLLAFLSKE